MAQQTINVGTSPNDGTGTPLRTAFQYTNSNFSELYTAVGPSGNNIVVPGSATITGALGVNGSASFNGGALAAYLNGLLFFGSSGNITNIFAQSSGIALKNNSGSANLLLADNSGVFTFGDGAGGTRMTLNSTGLGVGAGPSYKLDVNGVARVNSGGDGLFFSSASAPDLYVIGVNYYNNNGTEGVQVVPRPSWKIEHKNSSDALAYLDIGFRAASAAASAFTSRFKIDGSGNIIIATSATPPTLATNGQLTVNATSNTNLRFSYRGSDGVTRVANITLA